MKKYCASRAEKMYKKWPFPVFIFLMWCNKQCQAERVIVNMANGGTSRPILLHPLNHDHHQQTHPVISYPVAQALKQDDPFDAPWNDRTDDIAANDANSAPQKKDEDKKSTADNDKDELPNIIGDYVKPKNEPPGVKELGKSENKTLVEDNEHGEQQETTKSPIPNPQTNTTTPTTTTTTSITTTFRTTHSTNLPQAVTTQPVTSPGSTSNTTMASCHQSCLEALAALKLYSNHSLIIPQGSDLTLVCELPLTEAMYVENLIWLFHTSNSPEGQCSLTSQEFLPLCPGFPTITNTDDRNATFLQEVLTLANLRENHTGQYMCQVKVTCCKGSEEHLMSEEHIMDVAVSVWWADYITDLAVAGTLAGVLLALLIVVTIWLHRRRVLSYKSLHNKNMLSNTKAVLHLPLTEDDDDSFDSDEHE